ncbi:thiopurine S-methyltransferase [Oceanobacter sp. 4_MG-2023]|uniref:thiopurine S-methyltransferase n=1 Tax=Oceanobacter sp. 4_MG-2023 TaxID=3062623 RepID=UPI0027353698|nr:thiopurine S-methyltransferase [Oceanobacter sp. 4_MG-2023]MDP2546619.1 thiopurine S-methyltransferase [Oceanobacter sp. 4_MG-2023]
MDASFWHAKWERGEIGFHQNETNPVLVKYYERLALKEGQRVFLPLCGKTLDIGWLLGQGVQVAGAELNESAIQALFAELGVTPEIRQIGPLLQYQADGLDIFVGDIFDLSAEVLGEVDAIYDRAALVALPPALRQRYSEHLRQLTDTARQLLVSYEYDQEKRKGPPFSVPRAELHQHYDQDYRLLLLETEEIDGVMKNRLSATESVWILQPLS